jgi:hypothetical protein
MVKVGVDPTGANLALTFHKIDLSASGADQTVLAGTINFKIRVLSIVFTTDLPTKLTFQSNSTALIPQMSFGANGGIAHAPPRGYFCECNSGESLKVSVSDNAKVSGQFFYALVPTGGS